MNDKPKGSQRSPLDVKGIDSELSTEEIVEIVREMRERVPEWLVDILLGIKTGRNTDSLQMRVATGTQRGH
jgi:hypothetical protein